jgi:hypothetical protein
MQILYGAKYFGASPPFGAPLMLPRRPPPLAAPADRDDIQFAVSTLATSLP